MNKEEKKLLIGKITDNIKEHLHSFDPEIIAKADKLLKESVKSVVKKLDKQNKALLKKRQKKTGKFDSKKLSQIKKEGKVKIN